MKRRVNTIRFRSLKWLLEHTQVGRAILHTEWFNGWKTCEALKTDKE